MKNHHRVVWSKGMFLTPQHFQTQDQYAQQALHFRLSGSCFANWGVTELEIDRDSLQNGEVRLIRCAGLMPDGEPFQMPDVDPLPPSRTLAGYFPETQRILDVYLALPEHRLHSHNVTLPAGAATSEGRDNSRYTAETLNVPDENRGEEEMPVQVAMRNFRLLFGGEVRDGYTALRIGQVTRNSAGIPIPKDDFVAPCLDLAHSEYLMRLLRRQIEILANKCSTLSGARRQRAAGAADFNASEVAAFWLLHTVNSYIPELRHIFRVRHGHPEVAYTAMLRLAGALSTFSLESSAAELPDYDHDNLGGCFRLLDTKVRELMETVVRTNYIPVPLSLIDRFVWAGAIDDDRYLKNAQFFLAVSARMGVDDIIRNVPQYIKVASKEDIHLLIQKALGGVTLRHTPTPPSSIPMKLDNQYFSLNQSGPLWESIRRSRTVAVFAPTDIIDPKMEIIVVLEQGG
ncbi:MAG: type VI secretion system baseplate subunit TssK [Bryobacteraceae bacterium]|nr:type VI secretion system baseplate subunit TssK [Bryobacteraceae bacterium]